MLIKKVYTIIKKNKQTGLRMKKTKKREKNKKNSWWKNEKKINKQKIKKLKEKWNPIFLSPKSFGKMFSLFRSTYWMWRSKLSNVGKVIFYSVSWQRFCFLMFLTLKVLFNTFPRFRSLFVAVVFFCGIVNMFEGQIPCNFKSFLRFRCCC